MVARRRISGKQPLRAIEVVCTRTGAPRETVFTPLNPLGIRVARSIHVDMFVGVEATFSGLRQKLEQHLGIRTTRHSWGADGPSGSDEIGDDEQRLDEDPLIFEDGMRFDYDVVNMNITLRKLNSETFTVGVDRFAQIGHTIGVIGRALGVQLYTEVMIDLVLDGHVLDWDDILAENGVNDGDELYVVIKPC